MTQEENKKFDFVKIDEMKYKKNKKYCKKCINFGKIMNIRICKRHWAINEFTGVSAGANETNFNPNINGDCEYYNKKCDYATARRRYENK